MDPSSLPEEVETPFLVLEIDTEPSLVLVIFPAYAQGGGGTVAYWRRADSFLTGFHRVDVGVA
jgi:hypothetical protein